MAVRRLAAEQPASFAFTEENRLWAEQQIAKYPPGRQASAVIALLWKAQEQAGGWVPEPAIRAIADMLGMPYIRVMEVATFYTMFNLAPRGKYLVQLCGTTPCALRGANELKKVCHRRIGGEHHVTADGLFSWVEVECLGACVNAPMVQINYDYYEDLTPESLDQLLDQLARGENVAPGPQVDRQLSAPLGGPTTLTDAALYDGSVVGAWRARFEEAERLEAEKAAAAAAQAPASGAPPAPPAVASPPAPTPKEPPPSPTPPEQLAKREAGRPEQPRGGEQAHGDTPADRVQRGEPPISTEQRRDALQGTGPGTASGQTADRPVAPDGGGNTGVSNKPREER